MQHDIVIILFKFVTIKVISLATVVFLVKQRLTCLIKGHIRRKCGNHSLADLSRLQNHSSNHFIFLLNTFQQGKAKHILLAFQSTI